jgi:hypothetical protein
MYTDQLTPEQIADLHEQLRRDSVELEEKMLDHAKSVVISSESYLTAKDIVEMVGSNSSLHLEQWRRDKAIFAFSQNGADYFPIYAFDPHSGYKPYQALVQILNIFGDTKGGWGCAFWFEGINGYLDGKAPKELLASDPSRVIAAAALEIERAAHG